MAAADAAVKKNELASAELDNKLKANPRWSTLEVVSRSHDKAVLKLQLGHYGLRILRGLDRTTIR